MPGIDELFQMGGFAVLALAFLYTQRWITIQFTSDLKENNKSLQQMVARQGKCIGLLSTTIVSMQALLIDHDMTATGINTGLDYSEDSKEKMLQRKYKSMEEILRKQQADISEVIRGLNSI